MTEAERTLPARESTWLRDVPSGRDGGEEDLYVVDADFLGEKGRWSRIH